MSITRSSGETQRITEKGCINENSSGDSYGSGDSDGDGSGDSDSDGSGDSDGDGSGDDTPTVTPVVEEPTETPKVIKTQTFHACMKKIRDENAKARISARIDERLCVGLAGDRKHLGGGLKELKIHYGKGYRVYYIENDDSILILWAGHKGTQSRDIKKAKELAEEGNEQWLLK